VEAVRVLVACEFSGVVRDAFAARGHYAVSCDLLRSETRGKHLCCDVRNILDMHPDPWDLMIAHPPCTRLALSGARWFKGKEHEQEEALGLVRILLGCGIPRIALENPKSIISTRIRKKDQTIHPWWFGHPEFKETWLWLKNLPPLAPTEILMPPAKGTDEFKKWSRVHYASPGPDRWKERSRTLPGIAAAMAEQWG
jgi:hypothetical protein